MSIREPIRSRPGFRAPSGLSRDALLDAIVDASEDAVLMTDGDGIVTTWNVTAARLFGHGDGEIVGRPISTLFPAHAAADVQLMMKTVASGNPVSRFETEALRDDGMPIAVSLSARPVAGTASPSAAVVIVRDITERRLAQAMLAEVESRVCESEALAHVGSWLWDVGTGAMQWSDECHRLHGVDPLEFAGTFDAHLDIVEPDDRAQLRAHMLDAVRLGQPFEDRYRLHGPGGQARCVVVRAQPTITADGTVVALRGVVRETTD